MKPKKHDSKSRKVSGFVQEMSLQSLVYVLHKLVSLMCCPIRNLGTIGRVSLCPAPTENLPVSLTDVFLLPSLTEKTKLLALAFEKLGALARKRIIVNFARAICLSSGYKTIFEISNLEKHVIFDNSNQPDIHSIS